MPIARPPENRKVLPKESRRQAPCWRRLREELRGGATPQESHGGKVCDCYLRRGREPPKQKVAREPERGGCADSGRVLEAGLLQFPGRPARADTNTEEPQL